MGYKRGKSWYSDFWHEGKRYKKSWGQVSASTFREKDRKFHVEVTEGRYQRRGEDPTFKKFSEEYFKWAEVNKRASTVIRDHSILAHLLSHFRGRQLSQITPYLVEKYKVERRRTGVKEVTVNRELALLRHMFNSALSWGRAKDNPVRQVKPFREREKTMTILSHEQEQKLLKVLRESQQVGHFEDIIIAYLNTGFRKRELLDLTWSQVKFSDRYLVLTNTKGGEVRKVPINSTMMAVLDRARAKERPGPYIFANPATGKPYKDILETIKVYACKIGLPELRIHDLRHTFASRLVMTGVDLPTVKELMGHKDITMTMRYAHPSPDHKRQAIENLAHSPNHSPAIPAKVVTLQNR
ncbi:tyrosine-type recombinase/integrase [Thermodesulfobacteriota bacterium]